MHTELVKNIAELLQKSGKTVSAAESCTGGLISANFTALAGSSAYYLGSVTSYANSVKINVLGVDPSIIETFGAVSCECVAQMVEGVRKITGSDFAIATSGIAGPGGGSEEKPVGLVWIGYSSANGTKTFKKVFNHDRSGNIEAFAGSALEIFLNQIKSELTI